MFTKIKQKKVTQSGITLKAQEEKKSIPGSKIQQILSRVLC